MTPRLAIVLSGGCLRGLAHVGVLKALAGAGIRPDLVVGSSAGAVVGGLYAAGCPVEEIERAARELIVARLKCWALSRHGLWNTAGLRALIRQYLRCERIEAFPIAFAAVATNLATGRAAVFSAGDAADAIVASAAMPRFFVAPCVAGVRYADGCLSSPLPVGAARALGARQVIAVNALYDPGAGRAAGCLGALLQPLRQMMHALAAHEAAGADLVIAPRLPPEIGTTVAQRQQVIDLGESAARAALRSHWITPPPRQTSARYRTIDWPGVIAHCA